MLNYFAMSFLKKKTKRCNNSQIASSSALEDAVNYKEQLNQYTNVFRISVISNFNKVNTFLNYFNNFIKFLIFLCFLI